MKNNHRKLKIVNVEVLNENAEETFVKILKEGVKVGRKK